MPSVHRSRIARVALALSLLATSYGARPTAAATDRLPDLRMANLSTFYTESAGAERRLRFTTIMTNEGAGPLEVRGTRGALTEAHLRTRQAIYDTAGGVRLVNSRALMEYARDGHDHWHIQGVMLYQLWSNNGVVRRGSKVGFCFLDSRRYNLSLPGAPQSQVYPERVCGDSNDLSNRMGLSVGWGDEYPANFAFQWIDITGLPAGEYTVQARADEQNWYVESSDTNNCAWARVRIAATNGTVSVLSSGRTCQAPPASTAKVERQYGSNRYETAAAVSEDAFVPGVPVAYVTTGAAFPDALAAGAAAGSRRAPVVLVERDRLPALATTELERLNPQRIVVVGGTGVVSAYVASLVGRFQTGGGTARLAGADRYATAAAVSAATFAPGVPTAYIASGNGWPDALAAVPHAGRAGGPLLLTNRGSLPAVVKTELQRLRAGRIIVVGGTGVVSQAVESALDAYTTGAVIRLSGADRYATAAAISAFHLPSGAPLAYVATGENFPDALAAGPAAALRGASTILVRPDSIPARSAAELDRLDPRRLILLGGPQVINQAVASGLARYAAN
ncbi:MAG TPA: cell wall-binding repeat-containing protein [Candidatus Limnocylindria bacterium]